MSLGFKRVISSIMAFVMMVSTLVMVNVTGVMAADSSSVNVPVVVEGTDTSITAIQNDLASYADYFEIPIGDGKDTSITSKDGTYTGSIKISNGTASVSINGVTVDGVKANSKASNNVIKGLKAGDTVVFDLLWNSNSTGTMKFAASADGFSSAKDNGKSIDFPVADPKASYQVSVTVTKDTDLYFYNDQQIAVKYIGIKSANQNEYTVSGTINGFSGTEFTLVAADGTTKYTAKNVTTSGFTVSSATALTAGEYTVQADGYKDATVTLVANGENAFTFGSIAFEAAPTATITVTNSTGTTLENVYYWLNTNSGTARQTAADGVISNIDTSTISTIYVTAKGYKGQAVPVSAGSSTVKLEALTTTAISTGASSITPAIIETALDVTSTASYTNPIIVSADINGFKLNGEFLVQLGFDNSNKAIDTDRIQTSADSIIKYTPSSNGTLTINGASSSSNESAKGRGFTIVGEGLNENVDYNASTAAVDKTYELTAGTEYTITVVNGAINLYSISFAANASGTTTTTETTTEVTTTTATTTTEEPDTEESTEAPVTPGEGYVAMGSYDFNSSKISDTTGTYANMEFNLRQINDANVQLRGEAEGNFIRFKVASASNLTATFEDNALIMIGSDGSNVNLVSGVAVNLQADVIYTLRGEDGNNTYLSNLTFATGGTSEETTEGTTAEVTETTTEAVTGDEIRVPISITGNSGDIKININGTDRTFGADGTIELYLTEGSEIKFDFATDVANKIVGWEGLDVDSYVNNTHEYFSATATTSGVHFTYNADAQTAIDEDFAVAGSDVVLDYGNYGYGDNKGTAPGATQAESVAALNSVSGVVTLREFLGGGYKTNDQRLILNNNDQTGASFTVEGAGYLIIDCGRGTPKVTVNGETATATAIGNSGKQGYALEAGDKVVITKGTTNGDSMQLKSIRFQTDGNVFNNVSGTAGTAVVDYDTLDEEAKAELGTVPEGKVFARIVGSLNTNLVDADTVGTVGMLVIKKSSVDSAISASDNFAPAQSLEVEGAINLEESEALYDGIYDGNAAVDGEYTLDPNTAYSDGIYYMLRYVALDPEAYYVFPYTIESGSDTPVFDFANAVADTDLSSYMLDASVQ